MQQSVDYDKFCKFIHETQTELYYSDTSFIKLDNIFNWIDCKRRDVFFMSLNALLLFGSKYKVTLATFGLTPVLDLSTSAINFAELNSIPFSAMYYNVMDFVQYLYK